MPTEHAVTTIAEKAEDCLNDPAVKSPPAPPPSASLSVPFRELHSSHHALETPPEMLSPYPVRCELRSRRCGLWQCCRPAKGPGRTLRLCGPSRPDKSA